MWTAKEKLLKAKGRQICFTSILWYSTKAAFLFSLTIEFLQLFLRLGTFQLSDLCYNTLGGAIGGVLYWMDVMRQFITQSEGELTRGCLLVLHRIRNNLMHGMKLLEGLDI